MQQVILLRWWTPKETYKDFYDFVEKYEVNPYKEKSIKWSDTLAKDLWDNFEVLEIERINKDFADYKTRKIMFNKYLSYIQNDSIWVWHSLWWTFFLKYLNELEDKEKEEIFQKIKKLILVAPACKDNKLEKLWDFKFDTKLENLQSYQDKIVIFGSIDDFICSFDEFEEIHKNIPNSKFIKFTNRNHFLQEAFPELLDEIKN